MYVYTVRTTSTRKLTFSFSKQHRSLACAIRAVYCAVLPPRPFDRASSSASMQLSRAAAVRGWSSPNSASRISTAFRYCSRHNSSRLFLAAASVSRRTDSSKPCQNLHVRRPLGSGICQLRHSSIRVPSRSERAYSQSRPCATSSSPLST